MFKKFDTRIGISVCIVFILSVLVFVSCRKENAYSPKMINQNNLIPFSAAGRIHNQLLTAIAINLKDDGTNINSYSSVENNAKQIALRYSSFQNVTISKDDIEYGFGLRPTIFNDQSATNIELSNYASSTLSKLSSVKAINKEEADLVLSIFTLLEKMASKQIVYNPIAEIDKIANQWHEKKFNIDKGEGIISGYCFSVARSSVRLWVDYMQKTKGTNKQYTAAIKKINSSDALKRTLNFISADLPAVELFNFTVIDPSDPNSPIIVYDPELGVAEDIAPWIAADVAGALGGAAGSILDNLFHSKPVDWRSAGAWAIGGAVGASALGPVSKLLSRFF